MAEAGQILPSFVSLCQFCFLFVTLPSAPLPLPLPTNVPSTMTVHYPERLKFAL